MAHNVTVDLPKAIEIVNTDMVIAVSHDGHGRLGKLLISRGNIEWQPASKSVKKQRLSWVDFAALMAAQGKTVKDKKKVNAKKKAKAVKKPRKAAAR